MKYIVETREAYVQSYAVEADSVESAIAKVASGEEDDFHMLENSLEYSHTLPTDTWNVYEDKLDAKS